MPLKKFQFTKEFVAERCDYCGRCLVECPVLQFPMDKAVAEMHALVDGAPSEALDRCTGCMACNSICPQDANPHTLIVSRWSARNKREGLPYPAGLVLPHQDPNLYTLAMRSLPPDELALVQAWERNLNEPPPVDTMIYAGCNMILQPFMMNSALFQGTPIFGALHLCCGEPFYRMGCWDQARAAAAHVQREFQRMKLKRVIMPCLAGYHLFKHVYPDVFDTPLDVEVVSIEDWLYERIARGEIAVTPLNMSAVLHDNCWPKASGEDLFDKVRALLSVIGVRVVEPPNTRERALCCGMCAGASRLRLGDIVRTANVRLRELDKTSADVVVNYCGGCDWLFNIVSQMGVFRYKKPRYHLLELVQQAAGEAPARLGARRARQVIRAITPRLIGRYLRGGRFYLESK